MKSGLKRIIIHWTAGGPTASSSDREHYHYIIQQDERIIKGEMEPEDNTNTSDDHYAAHTRRANTGAIGVSVCGMGGAVERPFSTGRYPLEGGQLRALYAFVARLCKQYEIPVTSTTVLTHAEVEPTLGIKQAGKWDITWLPGMSAPGNPITVGNTIRSEILKHMKGTRT
jgi:N-acetyl-anhydromuramyl-L-alanine amidase AmpD